MNYWVYVYELPQSECVRACQGRACKSKSRVTKCLYVGSSYLTPEKRMQGKHSHHVRAGAKLRYDLMPRRPFRSRSDAIRCEHAVALKLRRRYTVFQA